MILIGELLGGLVGLLIMVFGLRRSWGWLRITGVVLVACVVIGLLLDVIAK